MIRYLVLIGTLSFSGSLYGQATSGLPAPPTVSVSGYGAKCNWNGSAGTDDTTAFQAASNAASASYAVNGLPVTITVPYGCTLGTSSGHTTITVGSGVHWQGPGAIFVPVQSTNELFLTLSTNDVSFEGLTITMVSNASGCGPSQDNDLCSAIRWNGSSSGTGTAYKKFYARNNTIVNSGWGITVLAQAGLDTLSDIHIDGNTIIESAVPVTSYQYADAIHVGGGVSAITISHNVVTGRSDAGIALTSELSGSTVRQCQFATVTGNTLYEDRVGIDNSGCSHVQITGNVAMADIATSSSNPAFRSIYYNAAPVNVNVTGNTFRNYQGSGTDVTAKFDCEGGCGTNLNSKFTGNKFLTAYFRGSMIDVSDNTVEAGGELTFDWDTVNSIGSDYITVGANGWQNGGTVNISGTNPGVYFDDYLAPQVGAGISYTNPSYFNALSANFAAVTDGGLTPGNCVQAGTGGILTSTSSACGAGGSVAGGVSNANFVFVGDSITCGSYSSTGCQTSPVTMASNGYTATTTGTASGGSTSLTVASATNIVNGELVVGAGIPPGTTGTISGTTVTLSNATTAALSSTSVSFGLMSYPAQAMRRAALTGNSNTGTNVGVSGWKVSDITSDYTTHVHPLAPSQTGKPGYLFVQIGTNDILQDIPVSTFESSLLAYWQTALADGWTLIAFTIPNGPWSQDQWNFWTQENDFIRANGTVWNRLVDEASVLTNNYDHTFWNTDNLHPINAGYSIYAQLADLAIANSESVLPGVQVTPLGSGPGNAVFPVGTGSQLTTGSSDTAFGYDALQFGTTDYNMAAFGTATLGVANGSHDNTAFGHYSEANISTGPWNTALGSFACNAVTTGQNNLCLGGDADIGGSQYYQVQIGAGTNAAASTLQLGSWNLMDFSGNVRANTLAEPVGSAIASASTIAPLSGITHVTGTSAIATITPPTIGEGGGSFTGCLTLIADGAWTTTTAGNIEAAMTATSNTQYNACYDGTKWFIAGAGSGGSTAFSGLTAGTNTSAAMLVGSGASLGVTGSGTINATSLGGTAAASYAPLASPTFSGTPAVPTATAGTNTTQAASTAFVAAATANQAATNVANSFTAAQTAPAFFPQTKAGGPYSVLFDDYYAGANNASNNIGSPTGASCSVNTTYTDINHPGNLLLTAGTGGTGTGITCGYQSENASVISPNSSSLGWTWETAVYVPVLPGTTAGSFQAGLANGPNVNPWTTGIQFYLSSANTVTNDWYCRYSSTSTDSTVAAVAATWTRLTMVNDGTYVHWYINGTEATGCKTVVGSMPSSAQYPASWAATSLGASSVTMAVDYVDFQRATAR
jgi:hypothetical protein